MISSNCRTFPLLALLVALGFFPSSAQKVVKPDRANAGLDLIQSEVKKRVESGELPSISIGVIQNGKTIWKESFGFADVEKKTRATPDTIYALGSLSKSITGTALFKLVQSGKIDLDQPIANYLKSTPINFQGHDPSGYKVFHLLNMTAGIPHHWRYCYTDLGNLTKCGSEFSSQASFSAFRPGEVHLYSNLSFGLVQQIVSDVSGQPFTKFMRDNILRPAGMKETFTHLNEIPKTGLTVAKPYKADGKPAERFQFEPAGGGGFHSTVNDLLKYGAIHLRAKNDSNAVLSSATLVENHRVRPELPHGYYANGWGILPLPEKGTTLLSNGAIEGAASTLLVLPDAEIVIVVLVNKTVGNDLTDDIAFRIAGSLLPDYKGHLDTLFEKVGPLFSDREITKNDGLDGRWRGNLNVGDQRKQFELSVEGTGGSVRVDGLRYEIKKVTVGQGLIKAECELGLPEFKGKRQRAELLLRKDGDKLEGILSLDVRSGRPEFLVPYYVSLKSVR
ncbi:MAG: serine hydrolase domain-containing protein [Pyrinomonadaceae bacterium]